MAIKRVSVSGLPNAGKAELKNNADEYPKTSFLVSTKPNAASLNTSKQLAYKQLYDALSSQIASQFNIAGNLGSSAKPIYIDSNKKFKTAFENVGNCSYDGHTCTPIYMWNGALTPATSPIGSATKPIYMDNGTLKETNENVGGNKDTTYYGKTFTPIYMKAGQLIAADGNVGGCSYDGHTCTPIYMSGGALRPATSPIGSATKPIYMDNGTLRETSANVGNSTTGIYMLNGQFIACDEEVEELPRDQSLITGKRFELKQTVFFSNDASLSNDWVYSNDQNNEHYNDPTAAFRVANPTKNPSDGSTKCFFCGLTNPVNFIIDEAGWYLVHCEASSKPMAVGIKVNKSWTHAHPYFKASNGGTLWLPNLIYIDSGTRQTIDPIFHFEEGVEIGVYSCLSSCQNAATYNTDTWYSSTYETGAKFDGKTLYTANLAVNVNGHAFPSSTRGTKDAPFLKNYFDSAINNNPGSYKNSHFWIYTKDATLHKYYPSNSSNMTTVSYDATPKHGRTELTAANGNVYDFNYASSNAGKDEIWGTHSTSDIYAKDTYAWVIKGGTKKHYTGVTKNIKNISYIKVSGSEQWGKNDLVELLYLS